MTEMIQHEWEVQSGPSICFEYAHIKLTIHTQTKMCEFHIYCSVTTVSRKLYKCCTVLLYYYIEKEW